MADPESSTAHFSSADHEANGFFESAEDPTAKADSLKPEVMDASDADNSALAKPTVSSPATQEPRHGSTPNGHAAQDSLQQNGHEVSADLEESPADSATGSPQQPEEEPWKKRLYFVRVPKFPEDNQYAVKVLQEEIDVYKSQVQLLNESVNIVRMQRDSAKESVADAKESMNAATNAFQAKHREVEPLQTGKKNQNDLQRNVQAEYRDLEVRSEQELDAKIRDMENHMAHESIPISQERQMVKHIKKLRDSRQRVRQYEHMYAGIENARAAVRSGQGELKELLQERQVLFEDKQLQQTIFNKHRDELRSLNDKINEIMDERARVKEQQDGAYHRMQALKQQSKGKKDSYYQNRRFSQEVRKLIKEGKLEEARQMCEEQTNAALGHLQSDPEWRQEYLELWLHQRAPPYRITFDEYDFDEIPTKDGQQGSVGKAKAGKGKALPPTPALTGKERAQAIIDAAFAEVKQDMARKANAGAAGESVPGSEPVLPPALPSALPQPSLGEKVGSKGGRGSKGAAKPAKAVELPPQIFQRDEPFVLPPAVSKVEAAPKDKSAAEGAAAAAREQQVRAQQENQRRKDKAAERKQKANQKRKAHEAERKAQEAAAKAEAAAQQQKPDSDESTDPDAQGRQAAGTTSSAGAAPSATMSSAAAAAADKLPAAVKEAPARGTSGEKTRFVENLAEMVSCQVNAFSLRDRRSIRMLCTVAL
ncbi:hypothetical protein WJX82_005629 [Trebouxia sp. C0006]